MAGTSKQSTARRGCQRGSHPTQRHITTLSPRLGILCLRQHSNFPREEVGGGKEGLTAHLLPRDGSMPAHHLCVPYRFASYVPPHCHSPHWSPGGCPPLCAGSFGCVTIRGCPHQSSLQNKTCVSAVLEHNLRFCERVSSRHFCECVNEALLNQLDAKMARKEIPSANRKVFSLQPACI